MADILFLNIKSQDQLQQFEVIANKLASFEFRFEIAGTMGLLNNETVLRLFEQECELLEAELEAFALRLEGIRPQ